ncbi:luciferase family protein [Streptomyces sp. NPDC058611]|uniref:luciferase domain-containing protein n=1 Tax=unclassified Streptomyces TaxID=2593676 RepID=UPI003660619C
MNTARHASEQLMSWPALSEGRTPCGTGLGLNAGSQEIVHFHGDHEADVHLTRAMIAKLEPALAGSTAVHLRTGSEWVTVRLDIDSDIDLLATLVSAALQAATRAEAEPDVRGPRRAPCTRQGSPEPVIIRHQDARGVQDVWDVPGGGPGARGCYR